VNKKILVEGFGCEYPIIDIRTEKKQDWPLCRAKFFMQLLFYLTWGLFWENDS